jgi:hypothetical protein
MCPNRKRFGRCFLIGGFAAFFVEGGFAPIARGAIPPGYF